MIFKNLFKKEKEIENKIRILNQATKQEIEEIGHREEENIELDVKNSFPEQYIELVGR